jgi:hypothetical protein
VPSLTSPVSDRFSTAWATRFSVAAWVVSASTIVETTAIPHLVFTRVNEAFAVPAKEIPDVDGGLIHTSSADQVRNAEAAGLLLAH